MTNATYDNAIQLIKATNVQGFIEKLQGHADKLNNRTMAYLGLWNDGAVLDTVGQVERFEGLKIGDKLEIMMSPDTRALNPALIKSIHLVGDDIVVNGAENLFMYVQAEEIIRAVASFLRTTGATNVIFGGVPSGIGSWLLPKVGTPVALSSFGWGSVLPFEGHLIARDIVSGGCYFLAPEQLKGYQLGRRFWTQIYTPVADRQVVNFGHRVRDGYLYVTLRHGMNTIVEAWDLRPLLQNKKIVANIVEVKPEWQTFWGADIIGPVLQGNALALVSSNLNGVTFYGMAAPTAPAIRA